MAAKRQQLCTFFTCGVLSNELVVHRLPVANHVQSQLTESFLFQRDELMAQREPVKYHPSYNLDPEEIFRIVGFSLPAVVSEAVEYPDRCEELDSDALASVAFRSLLAVCPTPTGQILLFQAFDARQVLVRKKVLLVFDGVFDQPSGDGIAIGDRLAALHDGADLFFVSDYFVKRFLDVSQQYRAATDSQVKRFLKSTRWFVPDSVGPDIFDKTMRSRVSWILESNVLDKVDLDSLRAAMKKYGYKLATSGGKLVLPTQKSEMKALVKMLVDEFYTGELSGIYYQTNSKRKI